MAKLTNSEVLRRYLQDRDMSYLTTPDGSVLMECGSKGQMLRVAYFVGDDSFNVAMIREVRFRGKRVRHSLIETINNVAWNTSMPKMLLTNDEFVCATHFQSVLLTDDGIRDAIAQVVSASGLLAKLLTAVLETGKPMDISDLEEVLRNESECREEAVENKKGGTGKGDIRNQLLSALAGELRDRTTEESEQDDS